MRVFLTHAHNQLIISEEPRAHLLPWQRNTHPYHLALPYVFYGVAYSRGRWHFHHIAMGTSDLAPNTRNVTYSTPLPNVYENGYICSGLENGIRAGGPLEVINQFWMRRFNGDLSGFYTHPVYCEIAARAKASQYHAQKVFTYWQDHITVDDILDMAWTDEFHRYRPLVTLDECGLDEAIAHAKGLEEVRT